MHVVFFCDGLDPPPLPSRPPNPWASMWNNFADVTYQSHTSSNINGTLMHILVGHNLFLCED